MARSADLTAEKLLQAAHELLVERPGNEPSVSEICARAGVNVAMVSYCFGGKTQLLDALLARTVADVVVQLDRLTALDLGPAETLRRHVAGVITNYVRYPYAVALGERLGDPDGRMAESFARPLLDFHRRLLAAGEESGDFRPGVDPTFFFSTLVGACEFLFSARTWVEGATGQPIDAGLVARFTEHTAGLLLDGLRR
ncbi:TetR family transcriptional regulator [Paraconexibacter sp.]|uniref:TetR family transcriptional regulator n=1 Tax=Paraconexibacter sp. TaxID=2949640 RepID=UPI003561BB28